MAKMTEEALDDPEVAEPATGQGTLPGERKFRPDVEGLRALAVTMVVLYHAGVPAITGGYVGVDVFFVISGFLITRLLLEERERRDSLSIAGFYGRRVRRILPAATLLIFAVVIASYVWLGFITGNQVADDGRWAAAFAANIHFAVVGTGYFVQAGPVSPLLHMWSLGVEEQFYLVWPSVIVVVGLVARRHSIRLRAGIALGAIAVASLVWSVVQTSSNPPWAYYSPLTRAWELALGGLVAIGFPLIRRIPPALAVGLGLAGMAGILTAGFAFTPATPFPGSAAALPVVGTALVILAGSIVSGSHLERLLALRPVQWLGRRSYSLYLWHWPLLIIPPEHAGTSLSLGENLLLVLAAVAVSALTYRLVENPIRRSRFLAERTPVTLTLGAALVGGGVLFTTLMIGAHQ